MKAHSVRKHLSIILVIRIGEKDIVVNILKKLKEQHIPGLILDEIRAAITSFIAWILGSGEGSLLLMAHSIVRL